MSKLIPTDRASFNSFMGSLWKAWSPVIKALLIFFLLTLFIEFIVMF